ncbi:hypothetical protein BKA70DRAFT_1104283, partial [Coprinopsis sp. MPI-PUGE-AT-0042]
PSIHVPYPLFHAFPAEIQAEVFALTVASFPDTPRPYPFDSFIYRPGYIAPRKKDLALLKTCKRVYQEAKELVWKEGCGNDEETFWWGNNLAMPPEYRNLKLGSSPFGFDCGHSNEGDVANESDPVDNPLHPGRQRSYTAAQWSKIRRIHIFSDVDAFVFNSRVFIRTFMHAEGLRPMEVKITCRYSEWWRWDVNQPPDVPPVVPNTEAYYFPESVGTLIFEIESIEQTIEQKRQELEEQVHRIRNDKNRWKWKRLDDAYLELDEGAGVKEWDWIGTKTFGGRKFNHHPEGDKMTYIVKVLTFKAGTTEVEWDGAPFGEILAKKGYDAVMASAGR